MKKSLKITIIIFTALIIVFFASLIVKKITAFRYERNLDKAAITVDGSDVSLREFGYYIFIVEAFVQKEALAYDSDNPTQWWNTHFSAGADSTFVCDYAKSTAIDMCTCREIYYAEAVKSGITLSDTDLQQARSEADRDYKMLNEHQRSVTGLSRDIVQKCVEKKIYAAKYVNGLTQTEDFSAFDQPPADLLNWDGVYYQGNILPEHDVKENHKILDNLVFGKITVNYE